MSSLIFYKVNAKTVKRGILGYMATKARISKVKVIPRTS